MACADQLVRAGYQVELWRRKDGPRTASTVAPAFWYPFRAGPRDRVDRWAAASLERYEQLAANPQTGVVARRVREFVPAGTQVHSWSHIARDFVVRSHERGPDGAEQRDASHMGELATEFSFGTFLVDTSRYMPWLEGALRQQGVEIVDREVSDLSQVRGSWAAVVVATGLGSRELFQDSELSGLRGQLVRIEGLHGDDILLDERNEDAMAYVVPRHVDTILGATLEAREAFDVDEHTTQALLARCAQLVPSIARAKVLDARVGLRPLRPQVRVERVGSLGQSPLIANYGHGGSGVTLSWGCAREVVELVDKCAVR